MSRDLRTDMPTVAAWIDDLRATFGADQVNPSIRAGLAGEPRFWASENGHEIGTRLVLSPNAFVLDADALARHVAEFGGGNAR